MKRSKYSHEQVTCALRQRREENSRLKRLVAALTLDKQSVSEVVKKSSEGGEAARTGGLDPGSIPY